MVNHQHYSVAAETDAGLHNGTDAYKAATGNGNRGRLELNWSLGVFQER